MLAWVLLGVVALAALITLRAQLTRAQAERASHAAEAQAQAERIAALERAADDLRASEAAYRALVDAAPDWIWTCDTEGLLTFSNPAGARLLGHEELVGRPLAELTHPEERPALRAEGWSGVVRRGHADGTWRTVETRSIPVRDREGRLAGSRGGGRGPTPRARRGGPGGRQPWDRPRPHAQRAADNRAAGAPRRVGEPLSSGGRPPRRG